MLMLLRSFQTFVVRVSKPGSVVVKTGSHCRNCHRTQAIYPNAWSVVKRFYPATGLTWTSVTVRWRSDGREREQISAGKRVLRLNVRELAIAFHSGECLNAG